MIKKPELHRVSTPLILGAVILIIGTATGISALGACSDSDMSPTVRYTLTIHVNATMPVSENTITGAGVYNEGSLVNIRTSPDPGWDFVEWTGDIDTVMSRFSSNTYIVMNGNYDITANFFYPVISHRISNVVFNPAWPATLSYGERVKIIFDFETNDKTAVYIFIRPLSNGVLAPGYLSGGSVFYNPWQHKGEVDFTLSIQPGQIIVDQIRFQIMNIIQTKILYETLIPVSYTFQS